jgi:hypothetical protein
MRPSVLPAIARGHLLCEREDQRPGDLRGSISAGLRARHDDAALFTRDEIDRRVPHAARGNQFELRQPSEERARERRPLAHQHDAGERCESRGERILVEEMIVKHGHVDATVQAVPRAEGTRHVLIIVEHGDPRNHSVRLPHRCPRAILPQCKCGTFDG